MGRDDDHSRQGLPENAFTPEIQDEEIRREELERQKALERMIAELDGAKRSSEES